jgi:hypothetical protein
MSVCVCRGLKPHACIFTYIHELCGGWGTGPRPLELLLEQPARLLRFDEASRDELKQHKHVPDPALDNLGVVRVTGTPTEAEPFAPLRKRVAALELLVLEVLTPTDPDGPGGSAAELQTQLHASIHAISAHYREYVRRVCAFDHAAPPESHGFADLLATETQKEYRGVHLWIGGNATLGGALIDGRYVLAPQPLLRCWHYPTACKRQCAMYRTHAHIVTAAGVLVPLR